MHNDILRFSMCLIFLLKPTTDRRPTVYAFATRPIAKGEEICDAYSGVFSIADKEDRAIVHQRYHFQATKLSHHSFRL